MRGHRACVRALGEHRSRRGDCRVSECLEGLHHGVDQELGDQARIALSGSALTLGHWMRWNVRSRPMQMPRTPTSLNRRRAGETYPLETQAASAELAVFRSSIRSMLRTRGTCEGLELKRSTDVRPGVLRGKSQDRVSATGADGA